MSEAVDNITVFKFVKKLSTPFNKWRAFKHGIIDANGNILKDRKDLKTRNEIDSFTKLDVLVLNVKKSMSKIPGGASQIASYAAALYLLKEEKFSIDNMIFDIKYNNNFNIFVENVLKEEGEGAPTNNISSGNISGLAADTYSPKKKPVTIRRKKEKLVDEQL